MAAWSGPMFLVGQDQMGYPGPHSLLGGEAQAPYRAAQGLRPTIRRKQAVEREKVRAEGAAQFGEAAAQQDGAVEQQVLRLRRALVQHVLEVAETGVQAHHPVFSQRIDGRIGHLREILPEEVAQRAASVRQHRERRVVAHGADDLLGVLHHGVEDHFELLVGVAGGDLPAPELRPLEPGRLGGASDAGAQVRHTARPDGERMGGGELVLDLGVVAEGAVGDVHADHLPRPQASLLDDRVLRRRHHAGFGAGDHEAVPGNAVAHRPKAVAVHSGDHPAPIGRDDRRRAVPGLHDRVRVAVKGAPGIRHRRGLRRPCLGHEQGLGHRSAAAGPHQHFEYGIECAGVGDAVRNDGPDVFGVRGQGLVGDADFVRPHPVDVAAQGVDLAVVGEGAERLRQPPLGKRVGGVTLVEEGVARDEAGVLQVRVECRHLLGQHHALVDDRTAGEGADVESADLRGFDAALDAAADEVERALVRFVVVVARIGDHDLRDLGPRGVGLLP